MKFHSSYSLMILSANVIHCRTMRQNGLGILYLLCTSKISHISEYFVNTEINFHVIRK